MPYPHAHPLRCALTNELHARPFPRIEGECQIAYLAIKPVEDGPRDHQAVRAHLCNLLRRHGIAHVDKEANHYAGPLGRAEIKWEDHSEFTAYTVFLSGPLGPDFDDSVHDFFPKDWLEDAPGKVLTSISMRVQRMKTPEEIEAVVMRDLPRWMVRDSLATAYVLERSAAIAGDFRISPSGHMRFALLVSAGTGPGRTGRIAQRILEVETYRAMAMLSLPVARDVSYKLSALDQELSQIVDQMSQNPEAQTLDALLRISDQISLISTNSAFRFSAAKAYSAIVTQRIQVLREERILGRQLFSEFMMRRFDPAMRTCMAAHARLKDLSDRAAKAAELLSTRVSVATAEQNRRLLERMDERAALQMRLQETVEGLSVVAISYYAISLLVAMLTPFAKYMGVEKGWLYPMIGVPVIALVWLSMRHIKNKLTRGH